jgi:hypothetical protein
MGLLATGTIGFGISLVKGRNLEPIPPAKTIALHSI